MRHKTVQRGAHHAGSAWQGRAEPARGFQRGHVHPSGTEVCISSGKKISHPLITGDSISKVIPSVGGQRGLLI